MHFSVSTIAGYFLTTASLVLISFGVGVTIYSTQANTAVVAGKPVHLAQQRSMNSQQINRKPTTLNINNLGVRLNVATGAYIDSKGQWAVNDRDAFFAESTATPLIYGHNTAAVFAPISELTVGDTMNLSYADGSSQTYTYVRSKNIAANDTSILVENNKNTVLLLTCQGLFNESRHVAYFEILA